MNHSLPASTSISTRRVMTSTLMSLILPPSNV
jgi:hypothetical protein